MKKKFLKQRINNEEKRKDFKDHAYALKQAHTLCSSITTETEQREAAYIEAVRISIDRIDNNNPEKLSRKEIIEQITLR